MQQNPNRYDMGTSRKGMKQAAVYIGLFWAALIVASLLFNREVLLVSVFGFPAGILLIGMVTLIVMKPMKGSFIEFDDQTLTINLRPKPTCIIAMADLSRIELISVYASKGAYLYWLSFIDKSNTKRGELWLNSWKNEGKLLQRFVESARKHGVLVADDAQEQIDKIVARHSR